MSHSLQISFADQVNNPCPFPDPQPLPIDYAFVIVGKSFSESHLNKALNVCLISKGFISSNSEMKFLYPYFLTFIVNFYSYYPT